MISKRFSTKIVGSISMGLLLISASATAFAQTTSSDNVTTTRTYTKTYRIVNGERVLVSTTEKPQSNTTSTTTTYTSVPTPNTPPMRVRRYRVMPDGTRVEIFPEIEAEKTVSKSETHMTSTQPVIKPEVKTLIQEKQPEIKPVTPKIPATVETVKVVRPKTNEKATLSPPVTPAGEVPDLDTLYLILWSTLSNIEDARLRQSYEVLWTTLSPRLQTELNPHMLKQQFASLTQSKMYLAKAIGVTPTFEIAPHLLKDGRLRLRGNFDTNPTDIRFDLLFTHHNELWRLDAIAFAHGE